MVEGFLAGNGGVLLTHSTVSGNSSGRVGGGISSSFGSLRLVSSTVSGNSSNGVNGASINGDGGGIWSSNTDVSLTNSTVTGNSASDEGGGIFIFDNGPVPLLTIENSIVAGNFSNTAGTNDLVPDPDGVLTINHSLIGVNDNLTITGVNNLTGTAAAPLDPLLGPLADNGGPTQTHALLRGSPAIDAGDDTLAVDADGNTLTTDQRGGASTRFFDDPTAIGTGVDIGAFELNSVLVDNRVDENDGNTTPGNRSLREAIDQIEADPTLNTITFDPNVFTGGDNSVIRLTQGELVISSGLSIDGTSVGGVVITGDAADDDVTLPGTHITDVSASFGGTAGAADDLLDDNSRVLNFSVPNGDTDKLTLTGLTITGGRTTGNYSYGGGIRFYSTGSLTLVESSVSGNSTTGYYGYGGGIYARSSNLSLVSSTVSDNSTTGHYGFGGGISARSVSLLNSSVSGNSTKGLRADGGGVNAFDVSLSNSTVSGNSVTGADADGGGIKSSFGNVSLVNSTLSGNSASGPNGGGGGIRNSSSGDVSLVNSTLSDNSSGSFAGGISSSGDVSLVNSTLSGNSTGGDGGGILASNDVSLINSTLTGNSASGAGGGVFVADLTNAPALTIDNSIVAGNFDNTTPSTAGTPSDLVPDPDGDLTINHSLIGLTDGLTITGGNNLTGTAAAPLDPLLGPLADNGGSTQTHALLEGSPAIDAGNNALALDENGNPLTTDQRGLGRISDGDENGTATVDIGSVEVDLNPATVVSTIRDEGGVLERPDLIGSFAVTFSANVNIDAEDLVIRSDTLGGVVVDSSSVTVAYPFTSTAVWDLGSLGLEPGFYTFELSEQIGLAGGAYTESVYVALPGDVNLDGRVNVLGDAFALVGNLGQTGGATWAEGDVNDDEAVNVLGDAFILIGRLGQSVVPPAAAASFAAGSSPTTANYAAAAPVSTSSTAAQPVSFISQQEDDRDQNSDVQRAKKSPDLTALLLAGSKNLDAAFASSELIDVGIF